MENFKAPVQVKVIFTGCREREDYRQVTSLSTQTQSAEADSAPPEMQTKATSRYHVTLTRGTVIRKA